MTRDQFKLILHCLQQLQRMTIGSSLDFRVMTFKRFEETSEIACVEYSVYYKEKMLQYSQIAENADYQASSVKIKELRNYLRSNKWI